MLDAWLLDKFEKFSHWWQKLTGYNCFWLARRSADLFIILWAIFIAVNIQRGPKNMLAFSSVFSFFIAGPIWRVMIHEFEKVHETVHQNKLANPLKPASGLRLMHLAIARLAESFGYSVSLSMVPNLNYGWLALCTGAWLYFSLIVYFISCDPLPPAKSKIRKWLESALGKLNDVMSLSPRPAPVPVKY